MTGEQDPVPGSLALALGKSGQAGQDHGTANRRVGPAFGLGGIPVPLDK